jgi:hypothetical protein
MNGVAFPSRTKKGETIVDDIFWTIDGKQYLIEVLSWVPYDPGRTTGDPSLCYPPEGGEGEWRLVDPETGEEAFPDLTLEEQAEIEEFLFEIIEESED